jgi:ribosomal protein L37AE/L43A
MSISGKAKGAAKFVFVTIPAGVFGVYTLRNNHQTIKALYESLRNPVCPKCSGGVLSIQGNGSDSDNPNLQYTWACNRCEFLILGGSDHKSILPAVTSIRQEQSLVQFDGLDTDDRQKYVKTHTFHSRIFFTASVAFFLGFCWMLLNGNGILLSINWFALSTCMFVFGLKKSYRAWQIENGVLYVQGAFKSWFNNEKWLR